MLYYETLDASTLELLKQLLQKELFAGMRLVGGTALAIQYGHRKSIDLDLFGVYETDEFSLMETLQSVGKTVSLKRSSRINIFSVNGVKVDVVSYPYHWIAGAVEENGLRMAHPQDIAAMKLAAITGRGSKRDFFDLYFLLQRYDLAGLLGFYNQKFTDGSEFMVLKSLVYFEDAETDADPLMLVPVTWKQVKKEVTEKHSAYLKTLT